MASFFSDLFDSITNQQATPQQTIIPTSDLLGQGYSTAIGLFPQVSDLNNQYQQLATGNQLGSEAQTFGPAANDIQRQYANNVLSDLSFEVPDALKDLITTQILENNAQSGGGTSEFGKRFGERSLLGAGFNLRDRALNRAQGFSNALPSSTFQPGTVGVPDPFGISAMIDQQNAANDNFANLQEDTRRKNFSSLINTGGRILGTAAGAYFGGPLGAQIGGQVGGGLLGQTGVAGMQQSQQASSPFTSVLSGLSGMFGGGGLGKYSAGAGQTYAGSNGQVLTSSRATPISNV